jgi:ASC-1-like (ASCH) protein
VPLFLAKKEVFDWLSQGLKTIDIRKGNPRNGDIAVFVCGSRRLLLKVVKIQSGGLMDLVRPDNYCKIIPTAVSVDDVVVYLRRIYGSVDGFFTAYTLAPYNHSS